MSEPGEFSWSNPKSVVIKRVDAIAVYKNNEGNLVIRQQARTPEQGDAVLVVPIEKAWSIIEALTREVKGPFPEPPR
jgi:hypothetical protein